MVYFNFKVSQFMGNTQCSDNSQIETNCRVAGYMRMLYSACRKQNGFASTEMEKKCISLFYKPSESSQKALVSHGTSVIPVFQMSLYK